VLVTFKLMPRLYHCAAIVIVDEQHVTMADPLGGTSRMPREEFLAKWRNTLISLQPAVKQAN
jgi:predicted double-glycine peptidase